MPFDLLSTQLSDKALRDIGGTYNFHIIRAHEFYSAGINSRDIGDAVHGRVFHSDTLAGVQNRLQVSAHLLPGTVNKVFARQRVQDMSFDCTDDGGRVALDRYKVEPPAREKGVLWER